MNNKKIIILNTITTIIRTWKTMKTTTIRILKPKILYISTTTIETMMQIIRTTTAIKTQSLIIEKQQQ